MNKNCRMLVLTALCLLMLTGCCLSHQWQEADCEIPKTCIKCGKVEGEALGHNWKEASCTAPKTCTGCGLTEGEALKHYFSSATCADPATCWDCGLTMGEPLPHSFGTWETTDSGLHRFCADCSAEEIMSEETREFYNRFVGVWKCCGTGMHSVGNRVDKVNPWTSEIIFNEDGTYELSCRYSFTAPRNGQWYTVTVDGGEEFSLKDTQIQLVGSSFSIMNYNVAMKNGAQINSACDFPGIDENILVLELYSNDGDIFYVFHEKSEEWVCQSCNTLNPPSETNGCPKCGARQ